jgi:hypothetical protein
MNMDDIGRRFALVGGVATGIIALVVGVNAANDSQYWQSAVALLAAAASFGPVGYVFAKSASEADRD